MPVIVYSAYLDGHASVEAEARGACVAFEKPFDWGHVERIVALRWKTRRGVGERRPPVEKLDRAEWRLCHRAWQRYGTKKAAAEALGISRGSFYRKLRQVSEPPPRDDDDAGSDAR